MWNKDRKVVGPVNEECGRPGDTGSAPFGNWGVETETSSREDGFQFAGWCRDHTACKTNDPDDCSVMCRDKWYEWNTCTSDKPAWRAHNTTLYNDQNGWRQKSANTDAVNSHGVGAKTVGVNCPVDNDGDFYPDSGGCLDALRTAFSLSGHEMEFWELDHRRSWDDEIGSISFPNLSAPTDDTNCDAHGCDGDDIGSYRAKSSGTSSVSASAAIQVTGATFIDKDGVCCDLMDEECEN